MNVESSPVQFMFWIAEYAEGTVLPQYDPDTGKEHKFSEIDKSKLIKFGWFPFSSMLAAKVPGARVLNHLQAYFTDILPSEQLIAYRTNAITMKGGRVLKQGAVCYVVGIKGKFKMTVYDSGKVDFKREVYQVR